MPPSSMPTFGGGSGPCARLQAIMLVVEDAGGLSARSYLAIRWLFGATDVAEHHVEIRLVIVTHQKIG